MTATWQSPSNIALIKYWGKHGIQLPNNASLSLTLSEAITTTTVTLQKKRSKKNIELDFIFEGEQNALFSEKLIHYFNTLTEELSILTTYRLKIQSENSFPHSAGIASSASAMSALALCLCTLEIQYGKPSAKSSYLESNFLQEASELARLGSGSAARSLFPAFAVWGKAKAVRGSSNNYAIPYPLKYHTHFTDLQDTILIVHEGIKSVSSRAGHALMDTHPMRKLRYANANDRLQELLTVLQTGDLEKFCLITEVEALELHALMMTSNPSFILMKPNTLEIIERIRRFRTETNIPVCFTLDAGPNVHVLYPFSQKKLVRNFIQSELLKLCSQKKAIYDGMGRGPKQLIEFEL